jgi:hypothetical protein
MAGNAIISDTKNKNMKATNLGLWYVQIPNKFVVDPLGNVIEPKVYKGNTVVIINRKQVSVSKLPHLNYHAAMEFKKVFC